MQEFFNIEGLQILGQGKNKIVYQHPFEVDKVIKVMHPHLASTQGGFKSHNAVKQRLYQGIYRQFRREVLNYLQLCKSHYSKKSFDFPVEHVYGFVKTNCGLGLVVEKIVAPEGRGRTLRDLVLTGDFTQKHQKALKYFFDACCNQHVVFGEVNEEGIMYCENRSGRPEFVLVDGAGDKLLIPVRGIFPAVNAAYVRKVEQRICRRLNISYGECNG